MDNAGPGPHESRRESGFKFGLSPPFPDPPFSPSSHRASQAYTCFRGPYKHKHKMQSMAKQGHTPAAEEKRRLTRQINLDRNKAIDAQRGRLCSPSIIETRRVHYQKRERSPTSQEHSVRPTKRVARTLTFHSRLDALRHRLKSRKPKKRDHKGWKNYRTESIRLLQEHYPNSTSWTT